LYTYKKIQGDGMKEVIAEDIIKSALKKGCDLAEKKDVI
jgi:hypothetical protein